jgi:hypothetical protein
MPDPMPAPASLDVLVERWFADHFPNSPVATVSEHFNHVRQAVEELKRRLKEEN